MSSPLSPKKGVSPLALRLKPAPDEDVHPVMPPQPKKEEETPAKLPTSKPAPEPKPEEKTEPVEHPAKKPERKAPRQPAKPKTTSIDADKLIDEWVAAVEGGKGPKSFTIPEVTKLKLSEQADAKGWTDESYLGLLIILASKLGERPAEVDADQARAIPGVVTKARQKTAQIGPKLPFAVTDLLKETATRWGMPQKDVVALVIEKDDTGLGGSILKVQK